MDLFYEAAELGIISVCDPPRLALRPASGRPAAKAAALRRLRLLFRRGGLYLGRARLRVAALPRLRPGPHVAAGARREHWKLVPRILLRQGKRPLQSGVREHDPSVPAPPLQRAL